MGALGSFTPDRSLLPKDPTSWTTSLWISRASRMVLVRRDGVARRNGRDERGSELFVSGRRRYVVRLHGAVRSGGRIPRGGLLLRGSRGPHGGHAFSEHRHRYDASIDH